MNLLVGFSKITADTEISVETSQSTILPLVELPTQGTSGKNLSKMFQIGFSFSGSRIAEWIWKYIVGEPCSLYHLLNRDSSLSNCATSLKAKILFFILLSQNAGPTLTLSYKIYFTISQNGIQNGIFVTKITDFSYSNLEYSRTKKRPPNKSEASAIEI